jgi:aromatic ring-cleaving dioxygenase
MIQSLQRTLEDNHSHVWFRVYREHSRTITAMYDSEFTENTRGQSQPWFRVYREHLRTITVMYDSEFTENTRGQSHSQPHMIQSLQRTLEDNHSHVWFRVYREHSRTITLTAMYDSEFTENTRGQSQPWFRVYREHSRTITAMSDSKFTENTRGQSQPCMIQTTEHTLGHSQPQNYFSVNCESYMTVIVLECSL